jgi:predicted dehydrogenase
MTEALRVEGLHFVDCIAGARPPRTDGRMGLRLVQVIESATKSMRSRGETVAVEKPE